MQALILESVMSFTGDPFKHDIFVTYSHGSDAQGQSYLTAWSQAFMEALEREMKVSLNFRDTLRIFRDLDHRPHQGVDPMAPLSTQLRAEIGASALLVVLMSPDYLNSPWCRDERDGWQAQQFEPNLATLDRVPTGLAIQERIAVVRIFPTNSEHWPPLLTEPSGVELVGFPFFAGTQGQHRPLGWFDLPGPFSGPTRLALMNIVGRLCERLGRIKTRLDEHQRQKDEFNTLVREGGQTVYLHARAEHAKAWEDTAGRLVDSGFVVLPGEPDKLGRDPGEVQLARRQRVETLGACDALLLLGTADGSAIDQDMIVVGKHDRQSARSQTNKLLPCGLLDTVGPAVATPIRRRNALNLQTQWLDATQAEWPTTLTPWLAGQGAAEQHP